MHHKAGWSGDHISIPALETGLKNSGNPAGLAELPTLSSPKFPSEPADLHLSLVLFPLLRAIHGTHIWGHGTVLVTTERDPRI